MKVLGLIETPDDLVTKEYVDKKSNEIKKAGYITTAVADNKYQPKGNYQPSGDYAKKNDVIDKKYGTPISGLLMGMMMIALSAGHGFDRQAFGSFIRDIIGPYLDSKGNRIGNTLKKEELNPNGLLKFFTRDENKIIYIDDKVIPLVDLLTHKLFNLDGGVCNHNTSDPRPVKIWVGTQTEYNNQKDSITSDMLTFIKPDILLGVYYVDSGKSSSEDFFKGHIDGAFEEVEFLDKNDISFSLKVFSYMGFSFEITKMQFGGKTYIKHDDKITIPIRDIGKYITVNPDNTDKFTLINCIFEFSSPDANANSIVHDLNTRKTEYVLALDRVTDENGNDL